ncbi:MAG: protoporphyrinogen oxidase [Candidatus Coatesbacteria bacterium]
MKRVVVVGGGITGLAAALRLVEREAAVTVLEAASEPGGAIKTIRRDQWLLEGGPDAFITYKPGAIDLVKRLGLEGEVIGTNPEHRRAFIVRRGRLYPIPEGFYLLAPTRLRPFMTTRLLSWPGKIRAALDLILPAGGGQTDESLASFVRRRFGREVLDWLAQPLVAGIYTADPAQLSLRATFPMFLELEKKHRSLILAMRARRKAGQSEGQASGARYGVFASMTGGLGAIVDAVVARLPAGTVRCSARVDAVERAGAGWRVRTGGETIEADAVILALPAPGVAALVRPFDASLAELLGGIPYASTATVNLGYTRDQIRHRLDGFGLVVPAAERSRLLACTFSSVKYAGRAPRGQVLLRAFFGGTLTSKEADLPSPELAALAHVETAALLGIRGEPEFSWVWRTRVAMAQYGVGHLDRVRAIREREKALAGLKLAGNAYEGIGLPECIRSGEAAADTLA